MTTGKGGDNERGAGEPSADDAALFDFVDDWLDDRDAGRANDVEHYVARFPAIADAVRAEYARLVAETEGGPVPASGDASSSSASAVPPGSHTPGSDAPDAAPDSPTSTEHHRLGPYRLLRELGRGGQGAVWAAEDTRLGRVVALKVLPPSFAILSQERRARLRREAEIVARLDHPGICTVYEAEQGGDTPYIAMRLVEGRSLADCIEAERARRAVGGATSKPSGGSPTRSTAPPEREANADDSRPPTDTGAPNDPPCPIPVGPRTSLELRRVLAFFERTARALHAAHEAGVLHRDVKPANVMVTPDGEPVVLDFGQAKEVDSAGLTASGEVFGTPAYMSPEQLEAAPDELDRRVDVWALGVSLHEALCLSRPFEAPSTPALLARITSAAPADPRDANGQVGEDLRVVLATAMERDVARRYATALELAEDLRRVRLFEPIAARPAGPLLRFRRWVRRHPALAASTLGTIASLALGLVVALVLLGEKRAALETALARHLAARAEVLVHEDPSAALALAAEAVQRAPAAQTRSALYAALDACTLRALLDGDPARLFLDLVPSPDGVHAAAALSDGSLRLYDLRGGAEVRRFGDASQGARVARFAADGDELWSAGTDRVVRRWSTATGASMGEWELGGDPRDLLVESDAARAWIVEDAHVTVVSFDREDVQRWPHALPLVRRVDRLPGRDQVVLSSAGLVPPDDPESGRWIASFTPNGTMVSRAHLSDWVRDVVVDEAGHFVHAVAGTSLHRVRCGDFGEPDPARTFAHPLSCLDLAADGRIALAEFATQGATVWSLASFRGEAVALDYDGAREVVDVAFDATGERIATASFDRSVRSFDAATGRALRVHRWPFRPRRVAWTPDGSGLLTQSMGPTAHLWAADENRWLYRMGDGTAPLTAGDFAAAGTRVALGDETGRVRIHDATPADHAGGRPGALLRATEGHGAAVQVLVGAPDAARWISGAADGSVALWTDSSASPERAWTFDAAVRDAAFDASGAWFLARDDGGALLVARVDGTGEERRVADVACARFDAASPRVALAHVDGRVAWFDPRTGGAAPLVALAGSVGDDDAAAGERRDRPAPRPLALAVHPRGDELAVVLSDRSVHLVDARTGARTRDAIVRAQPVQVRYSPLGDLLLLRGTDGPKSVVLQDLDRGLELRSEIWHTGPLCAVDVSPDESAWLTASTDGLAFVMRVAGSRPIERATSGGGSGPRYDPGEGPVSRLDLHEGPLVDARFAPADPSGSGALRVLTIGADGYARVWPVDPLPAALAMQPRDLRNWEVAREKRLADPLEYEPLER